MKMVTTIAHDTSQAIGRVDLERSTTDSRGAVEPPSPILGRHTDLIVAGAAGLFLLAGYITRWTSGPAALHTIFTVTAFGIGAVPAARAVWQSVRAVSININVLMLLGAVLAAVIGHPDEGALLLFLFALSGGLESYALDRTKAAITSLRDLAPPDAIRLDGERTQTVPLADVRVGDRILVRPGDRVPLDGTVIEGQSALDESAITGESAPRDKGVGDKVFAGTFNTNGRLVLEVTALADDTTLAHIVRMVTEARKRQARVERLIDRIGPTYSTIVIVGSIAIGLGVWLWGVAWQDAFRRAIAVLIVGSPCALIIATPVAYLSGIAGAARRGVLIKGGVYLEALARAGVVAFDKTGTLTTGRVRLAGVEVFDGVTEADALRMAGAVEASSTHPLAAALAAGLAARGLSAPAATDIVNVPGQSLHGRVNGTRIWIGRPALAVERVDPQLRTCFVKQIDAQRQRGRTVSALLINDRPAILTFEDTPRRGTAEAISALRRQGIERLELLTGDHGVVAGALAHSLGLDGYHAEMLPEEKVNASQRLRERYGPVVMIGDGINDAPALARADVGIGLGSIGADITLDAAHIVLLNDRMENLAWLHRHSLRTARIVRQNLMLAIGVIVVLGAFAAAGRIPLPLAVIGHEGSTVLVALNALRLLRTSGS